MKNRVVRDEITLTLTTGHKLGIWYTRLQAPLDKRERNEHKQGIHCYMKCTNHQGLCLDSEKQDTRLLVHHLNDPKWWLWLNQCIKNARRGCSWKLKLAHPQCSMRPLHWGHANPVPVNGHEKRGSISERYHTHDVRPDGTTTQLYLFRGNESVQKCCSKISTPAPSVLICCQ